MVVASQATLEIVAKAKDEFSDELRRGLRRLRGDIDRNVTRPARTSTRALTGMATAFKGLAVVVVLRRLSREATQLGRELSQVASQATELRNRMRLTFGDEGLREVRAFAQELQGLTGRGILDTEETAGQFQVLFTGLGVAREQAAALSQEATKLTTDFSSFFDIDPGQTRQSLIAGLVGEVEVLRRRFNVAVNDQLLRAEALRLGYIELGEALNPAARAVATLSLAARQQRVALGDAERTSTEFANTLRNVQSQLRDLRAEIGQELNRALLELINNLGGVEGVTNLAAIGLNSAREALVGFVDFAATDGVAIVAGLVEGLKSLNSLPGIDFDTSRLDAFLETPLFRANRLQRELDILREKASDPILTGERTFIGDTNFVREKRARELDETLQKIREVEDELRTLQRTTIPAVADGIAEALNPGTFDFTVGALASVQLPDIREQIAAQFALDPAQDLALPNIPGIQGLDVVESIAPDFDVLTEALGGTNSALAQLDETARGALDSLEDQKDATFAEIEAKTGYSSILDLTQKNQAKFTLTAQEQRRRILDNYKATLDAIQGFGKYGATQDQIAVATDAATRAARDQIDAIKDLTPPINSATDAFLRFGQVAGAAIVKANERIVKANEDTNSFANSVEGGLAAGFNSLTPSIQRSNNALANFLSLLASSIQSAAVGELAGSIVQNIGVFGKGTPLVDEPQLAVVGDTAEAIVPLPDGRSIPVQFRGESGQSGGGGSAPNVTFNVSAMDSASVAQFFERNRDRIAEQMIESFYEKSNFRQVFTDQREF